MVSRQKFLIYLLLLITITAFTFPIKASRIQNFIKSYINNPQKVNQNLKTTFNRKNYKLNLIISSETFEAFKGNDKLLSDLLKRLNINTALLALNKNKYSNSEKYIQNLQHFIALVHRKGIKVAALIYSSFSPHPNKDYRKKTFNFLKGYLSESKENEKFDMIVSNITPTTIKGKEKFITKSFNLSLNKEAKEKVEIANNKIAEKSLKYLKKLNSKFPHIPKARTIQFNLDNSAQKQHLSSYTIKRFFKACNKLLFIPNSIYTTEIVKLSKRILKKTRLPNSVNIVVKIPDEKHRNIFASFWSNSSQLNRSFNKIEKELSVFPSFDGITIYDLKGLIRILRG